MSEYFPEPKSSSGTVEIELDLSNYATKSNLKHATGVDTSKLAKKVDLAKVDLTIRFQSNVDKLDIDKSKNVPSNFNNLKSKVDIELDIDKLVPVPVDLSKLSDAVKNNVATKDGYMLRLKMLKIKYLILQT